MDDIQQVPQQTANHNHKPPGIKQIERRYQASYKSQNKYQFPRKKSSVTSSITSNSMPGQYYNLYSQNGKVKIQPKSTAIESKNITQINTKMEQKTKTQILQVRKIIQYTERNSLQKRQKLKIITNKNTPQKSQKRNHSTLQQINIMKTPEKAHKNSEQNSKNNSKERSTSKKKLTVLSAHKLRKIESFKVQESRKSPRKGLTLLSKQKQKRKNRYGTQVRVINIF